MGRKSSVSARKKGGKSKGSYEIPPSASKPFVKIQAEKQPSSTIVFELIYSESTSTTKCASNISTTHFLYFISH
ncbi:hypothetical protein BVRB_2g047630 [Beta vulgaris subsp. vulgaris]|nr:hypothetical protein BVRB_2g047630 [Beta vulgaris subsp. vulgaris]